MRSVETGDFHYNSIRKLPADKFDALITYTRTWMPPNGVIRYQLVQQFLTRFYDWQPEITSEQCAALGLHELVTWQSRGQQITIYTRKRLSPSESIALLNKPAGKQ